MTTTTGSTRSAGCTPSAGRGRADRSCVRRSSAGCSMAGRRCAPATSRASACAPTGAAGYGAAMMAPLERVIRARLRPGRARRHGRGRAFYVARGWQRWQGPTAALTRTGIAAHAGRRTAASIVLPVGVAARPVGRAHLRLARRRRLVAGYWARDRALPRRVARAAGPLRHAATGRPPARRSRSTTRITADDRAFIERMDMFFLATADADGRPQCSYKGGDPGVVDRARRAHARLPELRRQRHVPLGRQPARQLARGPPVRRLRGGPADVASV